MLSKGRVRRLQLISAATMLLLLVARLLSPERSPQATGARAILDSLFALGLTAVTLFLALGIGSRAIRRLQLHPTLNRAEMLLFSIASGLGLISFGLFILGSLAILTPTAIGLWLAVLGWLSITELPRIFQGQRGPAWNVREAWASLELWKKLILTALVAILLLTLAQALLPPTDPDGLIDHLAVPQLYLRAGRLFPDPDFAFANYPLNLEMLFAIGLMYGSDTFARLVHLSFGVLLVVSTLLLGARIFTKNTGWLAIAILVGMPIFPVWASLAYIDLGWATYAFLMVYALSVWSESGSRGELILAGAMGGLALGTKYLAVGGVAAAGLWLLWHNRRREGRSIIRSAALFGLPALLLGGPWYLRNLLGLGNPVYPYFAGDTTSLVANYEGFGIIDYLLLPVNLYLRRELFVGVSGSIEFPSLFFLLALAYPFVSRSRARDALAGLTLLRYVVWSAISHWRFRYLLPAMPGISLLSAHVVASLLARGQDRRWPRVAISGLIGGLLAVTVVYSGLSFAAVKPWQVILGAESKSSYLRRELPDYAAKQFIQSSLPASARVYLPWSARAYYCDERCVPDLLRTGWEELVAAEPLPQSVATRLEAMGITHLLLSTVDIDYSMLNARSASSLDALRFLLDDFRPTCTEQVYKDDWATVLELRC